MANYYKCNKSYTNIAFVYDCRYDIQLQEEVFFGVLEMIADDAKEYDDCTHDIRPIKADFNIFLMTYKRSELLIFERLSTENLTMDNFKTATSKLNTSFCPQHLPLKTVFTATREVLNITDHKARKLAIFVLKENMTDVESDERNSRWLETEQSKDFDVQRLFVIIQQKITIKDEVEHLFFSSSLNNSIDIVPKIIKLVRYGCYGFLNGSNQENKCFHWKILFKNITATQAVNECKVFWPQSRLVQINSKSDLDKFLYLVNTLFLADYWIIQGIVEKDYLELLSRRLNRETNLYAFFIGLSVQWNNIFKVYQWNDGTPFVVDIPLSSGNEGEGCVYTILHLQLNIYFPDESKKIEWIEIDCNKTKQIDILTCESDRKDFNKRRFLLNDFKNENLDLFNRLIPPTFFLVLINQMNNELKSGDMLSLIKRERSYNVIQTEGKLRCEKSYASTDDSSHRKNETHHNLRTNEERKVETRYMSIHLLKMENQVCGLLKINKTNYNRLDKNDAIYLTGPVESVTKCLYEVNSETPDTSFPNNSHLQDCEHFKCPQGFIKCPNSYCIPFYIFDDGVKDCPHGEDENYFDNDEQFCTGKLTFALRNICVKLDLCSGNGLCHKSSYTFVCQEQCDNDSVCVSNIVRKNNGSESTFNAKFFEITTKIYQKHDEFIFTPQIYSWFLFNKLVEIDLRNCGITNLDAVLESLYKQDVEVLDVSHNMISEHMTYSSIQNMKQLQNLNMSYSKYIEIDNTLTLSPHRHVLDLSHTKSGSPVIKSLVNLNNLKIVDLRYVYPLDLSLTGNVHLDILDVRGTELTNIKDGYLSWLSIQTALYIDDFRICCEAIRGPKIPSEKCHAPQDAISSCQDLIGDPLKRVILWVVGVISLLGNMIVIIYRIIWDRAILKKAYGLFVVSLGVSDFIMGVYLLIIAGADVFYRNIYVLEDFNWRHSETCKIAGILSTFSSETSTMFICLITLDRYLVIRYPFGQHRFSKAGKIISLCLTLIVGVVVSVIPALFPGWEIYSSNGMCLALPFNSGRHMGWEYSAILFVGLNFILFLFIALGQIAIFCTVTSYKHESLARGRDDLRKAQDLAVARQLFLVAVSDFCCWFPIGIMGIMSLTGYQFNLDVYAWSAVLILPVNSAINPLIYTLPVIVRKIKSSDVVSKLTSCSS